MRLFLGGVAKQWYELRLIENADEPWNEWKSNFLTTFQENTVESWHQAMLLHFKPGLGTLLEYLSGNRRLLQLAEPKLPP